MARVTLKRRDDLPDHLKPLWDRMISYGPFAGQAGAMAQRLPIFEHMWRLLTDLSDEGVLKKRYLELGALFVAVGLDTNLLVRHTTALAARFKGSAAKPQSGGTY